MAGGDGSRISIVLATCNGEKFIEAQLESLLAQTLRPVEIIVSDDASADDTLGLCQAVLSRADIPATFIRNRPALGFRDNFLRAALQAKGDYVAFCDQDDVWARDKLAKCAGVLASDDTITLVSHMAALINEASRPIGLLRQGISGTRVKPPLSYDPWQTFLGFSMVFDRSLLEVSNIEQRFDDYIVDGELIAHDRWIMFLADMLGSTAEIAEPLVAYRQHSGNLFGAFAQSAHLRNDRLASRSLRYISATGQMIGIVGSISEDVAQRFPLFQKARCLAFLEAALAQLQARDQIYRARSPLDAFNRLCSCLRSGHYNSLHAGRMRWKSLGRDILSIVA